jgi:hypothetical protein
MTVFLPLILLSQTRRIEELLMGEFLKNYGDVGVISAIY